MSRIDLPDTLAGLIQQYCSKPWQERIRKACTLLSFQPGEDIFQEHAPADQLYIVKQGKVKVYSTYAPGSMRILRFARDGQVLGHRGIGMDFTYTVTATALAPTTVMAIPMQLFLNAVEANSAFALRFMLFMAEELRRSEEQTRNLINLGVEQRVAKALRATITCFGFDPDDRTLLAYTPSRQDLADYAGASYEATIRALSALQRKKLIKNVGKEIRIVDREGLEAQVTRKE
ncbi:MAG: Crp/Fnr family transcriptional regulator [Flavobacteriales bacterium]|nr:Crp/Fnr family transcriptional regulator [Flavobacteriales bacterium]